MFVFLFTTSRGVIQNSSARRFFLCLKIMIPPPRSITINILHDNTLTDDNRNKFISLVSTYNQLVEFYNVEELCADRIAKIHECFPEIDKSHFSIAMFYRFFIPHILPAKIEKAVYLDADIIVNLDINELWQIEMGNNPLAVVLEVDQGASPKEASRMCYDGIVKEENYFNSGVLVMNLEVLRKEDDNISKGMKFIGEHPKYHLADQEILNYCFETRTFKLPVKFNRLIFPLGKKFITTQVTNLLWGLTLTIRIIDSGGIILSRHNGSALRRWIKY